MGAARMARLGGRLMDRVPRHRLLTAPFAEPRRRALVTDMVSAFDAVAKAREPRLLALSGELSAGAHLAIGADVVLEVTGLRNPCVTLDQLHDGLMDATLERLPDGQLRRKAGIMSVVRTSGVIRVGDPIQILATPAAYSPLVPV